jgi:hypothetical protein
MRSHKYAAMLAVASVLVASASGATGDTVTASNGNVRGRIEWVDNAGVYVRESGTNIALISLGTVSAITTNDSEVNRGIALIQEGRYEAAIASLTTAIKSDRPFGISAVAVPWIAACYLLTDQPEEVVRIFTSRKWMLQDDCRIGDPVACKQLYDIAVKSIKKKRPNNAMDLTADPRHASCGAGAAPRVAAAHG